MFAACLMVLVPAPIPSSRPEDPVLSIRLVDGKELDGKLVGASAVGLELALVAGRDSLPLARILSFRGPASLRPDPTAAEVEVAGGSRLRVRILGGDEDGEGVQVESSLLGTRSLSLDLVRWIRFPRDGRLPDPRQLVVSKEDADKELLFRHASLGLDLARGFLFRISDKGVHFAPAHAENEPDVLPFAGLAALRLPRLDKPAVDGAQAATLVVLLEDGSRVEGRLGSATAAGLGLETSVGRLELAAEKIVAGHVDDPGSRIWLSELAPVAVAERGLVAGEAHWPLLFGWRPDRSVLGGPLSVGDRIWTRGIGAHARSELAWVVPEGSVRFVASVGIDDSARMVDPPGNADFRVLVDDELAAEVKGLKGGQGVRRLPEIRVQPGQRLRLVLDFADGLFTGDRGDWLDAAFLR